MRVPVHHVHCDRCGDKIGEEAKPDEGKEAPAYYRLVATDGAAGGEKRLDHLCKRCKREVELLDERIFSNVRVHKTAEKSEEKGTTSDA